MVQTLSNRIELVNSEVASRSGLGFRIRMETVELVKTISVVVVMRMERLDAGLGQLQENSRCRRLVAGKQRELGCWHHRGDLLNPATKQCTMAALPQTIRTEIDKWPPEVGTPTPRGRDRGQNLSTRHEAATTDCFRCSRRSLPRSRNPGYGSFRTMAETRVCGPIVPSAPRHRQIPSPTDWQQSYREAASCCGWLQPSKSQRVQGQGQGERNFGLGLERRVPVMVVAADDPAAAVAAAAVILCLQLQVRHLQLQSRHQSQHLPWLLLLLLLLPPGSSVSELNEMEARRNRRNQNWLRGTWVEYKTPTHKNAMCSMDHPAVRWAGWPL
mmetsp:Transcript_62585/g.132247  ORF Transcript_62585/g.132247 Transcript_62585/m.132247 type:complete len:328 (+) Transcript_62585:998-1981(+)